MDFREKVIDALCADMGFWHDDFYDIVKNYDVPIWKFTDDEGRIIDKAVLAKYLIEHTDITYEELAEYYGIMSESKEMVKNIVENVLNNVLKEDMDIDDENKGKFTATQKRTGKSTEELCHSKNALTRKRANFARMAKRGWKPLKEDEYYDDEPTAFEEYEQGYPNDNFDVSEMNSEELADWCQNTGDFLFVYNGLKGLSVMVANTDSIIDDIVSDLHSCQGIEPTHEVDYLFSHKESEFMNDYVCIFKVKGTKDGDYYVVYQQPKGGNTLGESLNESFNSNELRAWFKHHGGVKRVYGDEYGNLPDERVRQDYLGDLKDDEILYLEEFQSENDAFAKKRELTRSNQYRQRSDWDMRAYFTVYQANDGTFLLVGIDRSKVETGSTWGGEMTKKTADRKMTNGWNHKTRNDRYVDDSDTYYYNRKSNDFGLYNNGNFKGLMKHNQNIRSQMSDKEWKEYQNKRVNDIRDYLKKR